jgi:hypothetical protein
MVFSILPQLSHNMRHAEHLVSVPCAALAVPGLLGSKWLHTTNSVVIGCKKDYLKPFYFCFEQAQPSLQPRVLCELPLPSPNTERRQASPLGG